MPNSTPKSGRPLICLVANASTAVLLAGPGGRGGLREIERIDHPEGRAKGRDLVTDGPGRSFESGSAARGSADPLKGLRDELADQFARELCDRVAEVARQDGIGRVLLVAGPAFLGHLRRAADVRLKGLEVDSLDKDLTAFSAEALRDMLPELI